MAPKKKASISSDTKLSNTYQDESPHVSHSLSSCDGPPIPMPSIASHQTLTQLYTSLDTRGKAKFTRKYVHMMTVDTISYPSFDVVRNQQLYADAMIYLTNSMREHLITQPQSTARLADYFGPSYNHCGRCTALLESGHGSFYCSICRNNDLLDILGLDGDFSI